MSEAEKPTHKPQHHSRIAATLKALFRTRISAGLLVVLPVYVTILLVTFVFRIMRDSSEWVILALLEKPWIQKHVIQLELGKEQKVDVDILLNSYPWLDWAIAIFSVTLTISILYAIGVFAANIIGRRVITLLEQLVDRVPLVKTVYRSSKQIIATFTSESSQSFQRVALVPFPQEKMRCVGFITAIFPDSATGEELATVFIPTTPNPTTGYLQILRRTELVELDWSVEDAVRTIMSGGILRPDFLTIVPNVKRGEKLEPVPAPKKPAPLDDAPIPAPDEKRIADSAPSTDN